MSKWIGGVRWMGGGLCEREGAVVRHVGAPPQVSGLGCESCGLGWSRGRRGYRQFTWKSGHLSCSVAEVPETWRGLWGQDHEEPPNNSGFYRKV